MKDSPLYIHAAPRLTIRVANPAPWFGLWLMFAVGVAAGYVLRDFGRNW